ncbi:MAG: universal stress protein [Deltaproteobacteria bacterium]|nr:universal stress protein [Deltaproteobacteria bacterium]
MEVKTILWPTDLSKNSLKAARHVVSLANKYQARVIMLYVGTDLTTMLPYGGKYPSEDYLKHFQEWELGQARKEMETVCGKDLKACPMLEVKLVQGDPAEEILKMADGEKADMIVITTHGRGYGELDAKTPDFGSTVAKVIRGAKVPIHLVNPFMEP